jgi:hypothetical protein
MNQPSVPEGSDACRGRSVISQKPNTFCPEARERSGQLVHDSKGQIARFGGAIPKACWHGSASIAM